MSGPIMVNIAQFRKDDLLMNRASQASMMCMCCMCRHTSASIRLDPRA